MCVSHAQISYFHSPYVMERMQNGGSGLVAFDRAYMSCVEEISSQRYRVELKQHLSSGPGIPRIIRHGIFLEYKPDL